MYKKIITISCFFIIIILGLFLRIYNIDKSPLWNDELMSNRFSAEHTSASMKIYKHDSTFEQFAYYAKNDPNPTFYYLLVYFYSFLFEGGKSLRFISVIFSMFSLVAFYLLARLFFNRRNSLYALLVMAISPFYLWYAQEARAYSTACFFAILVLYFFIKAIRENNIVFWFFFTLSAIFSLYTSYYTIILLIAMGIVVLLKEYRRYFKLWWISILTIVILSLPAIFFTRSCLHIVKNGFWLPIPSFRTVFTTFSVFNFGYSPYRWEYYCGTTIFIGLLIYGAYYCYRQNKNSIKVLPILFFTPFILVYALSYLIMPIYIDRQLIVFSPLYYLLITQGLSSIKRRSSRVILSVIVLLLIGLSTINYYRGFILWIPNGKDLYVGVHYKKDYEGLMEYVKDNLRSDDLIMVTDAQALAIAVDYFHSYFSNKKFAGIGQIFYPYALHGFDSICAKAGLCEWELIKESKELYVLWFKPEGVYSQKIMSGDLSSKRIWLIYSVWGRAGPLKYNYFKVRQRLLSEYKQDLSMGKDGIFVDLYNHE